MTADHILTLAGQFWRATFLHAAGDLLAPATAPEGRSHYGGQPALYLSATPAGCIVAITRYMAPDDPPRGVFPVHVAHARVVDLRDPQATAAFCIDTTHRAADWQDIRLRGIRAPTWDISDRVRALGLDGMLYASRTDPAKTHLTLFRWNAPSAPRVTRNGPPITPDQAVRAPLLHFGP